MAPFNRVMSGFRRLFRKTQFEQELDAELVEFLERSVEEKIHAGLNREHAIRAARMELGSVGSCRDRLSPDGTQVRLMSFGLALCLVTIDS